jgi:hypothetical protein
MVAWAAAVLAIGLGAIAVVTHVQTKPALIKLIYTGAP